MSEVSKLAEKIRSRCKENGDCLIWQGARSNRGPVVSLGGKELAVRATIWEDAHGRPFPAGRRACVTCQNKLCLNSDHIVAWTMAEQMRATQRNRPAAARYASQVAAGRTRGHKIDDEAVHEIRYAGASATEMMKKHGVSKTYVYALRRGTFRREHANPFLGLGART
jgi:hypothetical protein